MPRPNLGPLYGAAFGFNTDRRVKPVHFATGFFLAVTGQNYKQRDLNYTVALPARKEPEGNYTLSALQDHLTAAGKLPQSFSPRDLHLLRTHLQAVVDNDDAVYAMFGEKPGFGSDYSACSARLVSRTKDNDGFLGQFVKSIFERSQDGQEILRLTKSWLTAGETATDWLLSPLLDEEGEDVDLAEKARTKVGDIGDDRANHVAQLLACETKAIRTLCENCDSLPPERRLRYLMVGLGCWVTAYLRRLSFTADQLLPLLVDMSAGLSSKMREQSRWSYTRFRESVVASFGSLAEQGIFDDCQTAWEWVKAEYGGRPKIEEFFRELLIRNGLAQPRGGRVNAKHFELQADTLAVVVLSVLSRSEDVVALPELFGRLFATWGLCFGGRSADADLLAAYGYFGLDEKSDLSPNVEATTELLVDLGFARKYSDGLVLCEVGNPLSAS